MRKMQLCKCSKAKRQLSLRDVDPLQILNELRF